MRIFLMFVLIFLMYAAPTYGLRPSESEYSEEFNSKEAAEISKEKENIIESITPAREEREKNLHPFVQDVREDTKNPFGYAVKVNAPIDPERKTPYIKFPASNLKPNAGINFIFVSIIIIVFLLSYFFIRPKSK